MEDIKARKEENVLARNHYQGKKRKKSFGKLYIQYYPKSTFICLVCLLQTKLQQTPENLQPSWILQGGNNGLHL